MSGRRSSRLKLVVAVAGTGFKVAVGALVLATPMLGVWLASSLAAHSGRSTALPIIAGLLAFPAAPLAWDFWSEQRRKQRKDTRERILTFADRLLLRTFTVSFTLIVAMLVVRPALAFTALSTRGDWMLDGRSGPTVDRARRALFAVAGGLEWLYELAHRNRYEKLVEDDSSAPAPAPTESLGPTPTPSPGPTPSPDPTPSPGPTPSPDPTPSPSPETKPATPPGWPDAVALHPLVAQIPAGDEGNLEAVARFIRAHEPNPRARIKALHDYVADRIAYDAEALADDKIPPQGAQSVFAARKGVCAGYANLLKAMAKVTGDEITVVVGDARTDVDEIGGGGHAWNAARIDGQWHLLDATWDAGHVNGRTFTKSYRTDYFLTPPEIFGVDHFPEQERWQLKSRALTRGEFMRQPMLRARFFTQGFRLEKPDRSQVTVADTMDVELDNPRGAFVLASFVRKGAAPDARGAPCAVRGGPRVGVSCKLPEDGVFRVLLFAGPKQFGSYEHVGTFEAVSSQ
ncbi:MAG: hypothetical protein IT377_30135 [Polyangiaceae bacterium]|nr:hypothetical protein [Polyangiaceae bacterium]